MMTADELLKVPVRPWLPPLPKRIKSLRLDERGFPVPWFVAWIDGRPDFRVIDRGKRENAYNKELCWICGQKLGVNRAFVIGPMCAVNRTTSEPPSHLDCAVFAATACPFLTKPRMRRNGVDIPAETKEADGVGLKRNPGVALIWVTASGRGCRPFRVDDGFLFEIAEPVEVLWFAEGRRATRAEVAASIEGGLPLLREPAEREGPEAVAALSRSIERAMVLLPASEAAS